MIHEYALEPEVVASWHDRDKGRFFIDQFGCGAGRIVGMYPSKTNWRKHVWAALDADFSPTDIDRKRMREIVQKLTASKCNVLEVMNGTARLIGSPTRKANISANPFTPFLLGRTRAITRRSCVKPTSWKPTSWKEKQPVGMPHTRQVSNGARKAWRNALRRCCVAQPAYYSSIRISGRTNNDSESHWLRFLGRSAHKPRRKFMPRPLTKALRVRSISGTNLNAICSVILSFLTDENSRCTVGEIAKAAKKCTIVTS